MNTAILGLLAESSVHPGAGQSAGFVDLPVAREAATDYPVIVGTSLKGALRDRARQASGFDATSVFGECDNAGGLLVSDARLVLLPVRSLTGHYRWVTCPHILSRLARDFDRAGQAFPADALAALTKLEGHVALGDGQGHLFLEERQFALQGPVPSAIIEALTGLFAHQIVARTLPERLVILPDDEFTWFARFGLSINARNQLDDEKKTSNNLWYEETLPPDSLFYALLAERNKGALTACLSLFNGSDDDGARPYLQLGGNETVGQGWFAVRTLAKQEGGAR